jgi:hypothetical protein
LSNTTSRLRSLRLTLQLLFVLAAVAVAGTIAGPLLEGASPPLRVAARVLGLLSPWGSPVFLAAAGLLVTNVLLCTWHRLGARPRLRGGRTVALLDAAVHFSLVALIGGGVGGGLWREVGTGYLFPGTPATTMYVDGPDRDVPLGFSVLLEEKREEHYPLRLKVGVRDAATAEKLGLLEVVEGRPASLPGGRLALSIRRVTGDPPEVVLVARTPTGEHETALRLVAGVKPAAAGAYELVAVAWRRELREVRGRVRILDAGRVVREGWLEVNGALSYRGVSVFLTSWGADALGNQFLGVQYRRDPAAPVFWAGAIVLALALPPFVLLRRRRVPPAVPARPEARG